MLWKEFQREHLAIELTGELQTFGEHLYLLPLGLPELSKLKIARNGLHLGVFKKKRFEPSFALGLTLKPSEVKHIIEIDEEQFKSTLPGRQSISIRTLQMVGIKLLSKVMV